RALARSERVVAPGFTPTILGDDALEIAVEVIGALERAIDIVFAEHLAAHGEAAVIGILIHGSFPPVCARGLQAPRAGFRLRAGETWRRSWPHRWRRWHARHLRATTLLIPAATGGRGRASPPAAGARPRARPLWSWCERVRRWRGRRAWVATSAPAAWRAMVRLSYCARGRSAVRAPRPPPPTAPAFAWRARGETTGD